MQYDVVHQGLHVQILFLSPFLNTKASAHMQIEKMNQM